MMDNRLNTFLCLCETMNYGKTAQRLSMTQPAVTQHIQYLERVYGVKLFTYRGRVLNLTEAGSVLEVKAKAMRRIEADTLALLKVRKAQPLCIGATKTIGEFLLPEMLKTYLRRENRDFSLVVDNTDALLEGIADSRIDFAMIEGNFSGRGFGHRLIKNEDFIGICGAKHPFAGKHAELKEVLRETLLVREAGSGTRTILEEALRSRGYCIEDFKRMVTINHVGIIQALVRDGIGVTFGYRPIADGEGLSTFTVEKMEMKHELSYVYLADTESEGKIDDFERMACEE